MEHMAFNGAEKLSITVNADYLTTIGESAFTKVNNINWIASSSSNWTASYYGKLNMYRYSPDLTNNGSYGPYTFSWSQTLTTSTAHGLLSGDNGSVLKRVEKCSNSNMQSYYTILKEYITNK